MDVWRERTFPRVDIVTDDRTRALDHLERVARAVAQRRGVRRGVAVLDDRTPRLWDANHLIANTPEVLDAQELADACAARRPTTWAPDSRPGAG